MIYFYVIRSAILSAATGMTIIMMMIPAAGSPLAAIAGAWLAGARALHIFRNPPSGLASAFEVELRSRFVLHDALWGSPTARIALGARSTIAGGGAALASTNANAAAVALIEAASPHQWWWRCWHGRWFWGRHQRLAAAGAQYHDGTGVSGDGARWSAPSGWH